MGMRSSPMGWIGRCNSKLPVDTCPGAAAIRILPAEIDECGQGRSWSMPINLVLTATPGLLLRRFCMERLL
jgi:hypothetical protein